MYESTLTESKASANEDSTIAAAGISGSWGALIWISRATSAILRRTHAEASGPKETVWNESGLLDDDAVFQDFFAPGRY